MVFWVDPEKSVAFPVPFAPAALPHGSNICLCRACGALFRAVGTFDLHRTGPHGARRCMTPDELVARGYIRDPRGRWRLAVSRPASAWGSCDA